MGACQTTPEVTDAYARDARVLELDESSELPSLFYQNQIIPCRVMRCIDGDTVVVHVVPPPVVALRIRLYGIDAREIKDTGGLDAKFALEKELMVVGQSTIPLKLRKWDKFGGRVVGELYNGESSTVNNQMLRDHPNLFRAYMGGKKVTWASSLLPNVAE